MTTAFVQTPWSQPASFWSVLTVAPTEEPFSVAQGKLRAGLDWPDGDPRDELMTDFIRAARHKVELDTGLALLTQTHEVTFGEAPCSVPRFIPLPAQTQPAQSISDYETTTSYLWRPCACYCPGYRDRLETIAWPGPGTIEIVSGWPSVAALQAEAPMLYHAVGLLIAHYATLGRDLATVGDLAFKTEARLMPMGYEEAIGPHRLIWVI